MRNPPGYGTIVKLQGNRRKPFAVRKTVGYTEKGYPKQKYLGYFATLKEAKAFQTQVNAGNISTDERTLNTVWFHYYETAKLRKSEGTLKNEVGFYKCLLPLQDKPFADIKPMEVQKIVSVYTNTTGSGIVSLWRNLEKQALMLDIRFNPFGAGLVCTTYESKEKHPFTEAEINALWQNTYNPIIADALILIYTGMRITEYLTLTAEQIEDNIITCGIKTQNGKNRKIPIHPRILPLIEEKLKLRASERLTDLSYPAFNREWNKEPLLSQHTIHETRHTFRTRLDNAGANRKCMDLLLGHKGEYVGDRTYTHKTIQDLIVTTILMP